MLETSLSGLLCHETMMRGGRIMSCGGSKLFEYSEVCYRVDSMPFRHKMAAEGMLDTFIRRAVVAKKAGVPSRSSASLPGTVTSVCTVPTQPLSRLFSKAQSSTLTFISIGVISERRYIVIDGKQGLMMSTEKPKAAQSAKELMEGLPTAGFAKVKSMGVQDGRSSPVARSDGCAARLIRRFRSGVKVRAGRRSGDARLN